MKALTNRTIVAALALFGAATVQAQVVTLPPVNDMTVGVYGDFYVYSLELLAKCQAAGDSRCYSSYPNDLSGPYPDPSNTATIANYVLIYKNSQGGHQDNYTSPTGPLTTPQTVDNPFDSATGVGSNFDMTTANEPSGVSGNNYGVQPFVADFAGDKNGTWEASLAAINQYLNGGNLFFFFGNNQTGASLDQVQYLWAQVRLTNAAGQEVQFDSEGNVVASGGTTKCWELNSTFRLASAADTVTCGGTNPTYTDVNRTPLKAGDFVGTGGAFCVDGGSGASFIPASGLPGKDADCSGTIEKPVIDTDGNAHTVAGYFISNNLGQNTSEFAAFLPELSAANISKWADAGVFMSVNFKARNLNDGGDQLWIRSIGKAPPIILVPEPATLALFGLGLLGAVGLSRRRRAA